MTKESQPLNESAKERFARLATRRVSKALKTIRLIGNLSNKSLYDFTEQDIEAIYSTLSNALTDSHERFSEKPKPQDTFELPQVETAKAA